MADERKSTFFERASAQFPTVRRATRAVSRWMPRKRYVAVGFLVLVVGGLAVWASVDQRRLLLGFLRGEAFFLGAPSSYWRIRVLEDGRQGVLTARTQMVFDQPDALGVVLDFANDPDVDMRWPALLLLQHCASPERAEAVLRKALDDSSPKVQAEAINALEKMGATASPSVARLTELTALPDQEVVLRARKALWAIDAAAAAKASGWKPYSPEDKSFSALFSRSPDRSEASIATDFGDVAVTNYGAWDGLGQYVVSVADYGSHVPDSALDQAHLAEAIESLQELDEGELLLSQPITQGGCSGWERVVRTKRNTSNYVSRGRIFQVGRRRYTALAVYSESLLPDSASTYFLDSFRIAEVGTSQHPASDSK